MVGDGLVDISGQWSWGPSMQKSWIRPWTSMSFIIPILTANVFVHNSLLIWRLLMLSLCCAGLCYNFSLSLYTCTLSLSVFYVYYLMVNKLLYYVQPRLEVLASHRRWIEYNIWPTCNQFNGQWVTCDLPGIRASSRQSMVRSNERRTLN